MGIVCSLDVGKEDIPPWSSVGPNGADALPHAQAWCPAQMTPADLVFLEPKLLLVEDPSSVGLCTWRAIARVARSACQQMAKEGPVRLVWDNDLSKYILKVQDSIRLCDAVPVCHIELPFLACIDHMSHGGYRCMIRFTGKGCQHS